MKRILSVGVRFRSRNRVIAASVCLGAVLFLTGFFSYPLLHSHLNTPTSSGKASSENLGIGGFLVLKAYHTDGTLYYDWGGHNSLGFYGKKTIAYCGSGNNTAPSIPCSNWVMNITLSELTSSGQPISPSPSAYATNTLLPTPCNPQTQSCDGWQSQASIPITTSGTVSQVYSQGKFGGVFDVIPIPVPLAVSQGDTVVATITFTIS